MNQRGFTLIELVIVIVILGVLAVTAAPRFMNLQGDAQASTLQAVRASIESGMHMVYAKSAIAGEQKTAYAGNSSTQVTINSVGVYTDYGYPDADTNTTARLGAWLDIDFDDWDLTSDSPAEGSFAITPEGVDYTATTADQCQVIYTEASSATTQPTVEVQDSGC